MCMCVCVNARECVYVRAHEGVCELYVCTAVLRHDRAFFVLPSPCAFRSPWPPLMMPPSPRHWSVNVNNYKLLLTIKRRRFTATALSSTTLDNLTWSHAPLSRDDPLIMWLATTAIPAAGAPAMDVMEEKSLSRALCFPPRDDYENGGHPNENETFGAEFRHYRCVLFMPSCCINRK